MEEAFGADFSTVRVHTGAESAAMNEQIGARAFTYGTDIHFNEGEFTPGTERGTRLLAHELTHVVQQNSGVRRAPKRIQAKLQLVRSCPAQHRNSQGQFDPQRRRPADCSGPPASTKACGLSPRPGSEQEIRSGAASRGTRISIATMPPTAAPSAST